MGDDRARPRSETHAYERGTLGKIGRDINELIAPGMPGEREHMLLSIWIVAQKALIPSI